MLIIFGALKIEISGLIKIMSVKRIDKKGSITKYRGCINGKNVLLVETGMGKKNAQKAAKLIAENYLGDNSAVRRILVAGFCGATSRNLQIGDVVLYKSIKNLEHIDFSRTFTETGINFYDLYDSVDIDYNECIKDNYKLLKVNGGTVSKVIVDSELKKAIGAEFDVQAIDTETYWIGKVIIENNLPFCCIRSVSDCVDENIPDFFVNLFEKSIPHNIFKLLFLVIKSPKKIFQITKTIRNVKKAKDNLTATIRKII